MKTRKRVLFDMMSTATYHSRELREFAEGNRTRGQVNRRWLATLLYSLDEDMS